LLAVASRLPRTKGELARVKGVHSRWVDRNGDRICRELSRVAAAADAKDFVPIEPAAYADFDEIRLDGWLSFMRAEVSASLGVAPELVFNARTLRAVRAAIVQGGSRSAGADALTGWRRELLLDAYLTFAREQ
jgi:ribonuclease D